MSLKIKSIALTLVCLTGMLSSVSFANTQQNPVLTAFFDKHYANAAERIEQAKVCTIQGMYDSGSATCITGHPNMASAILSCDTIESYYQLNLDDPQYFFCPPAKWVDSSLKNNSVSKERSEVWEALRTSVAAYGMTHPTLGDVLRKELEIYLASKGFSTLKIYYPTPGISVLYKK